MKGILFSMMILIIFSGCNKCNIIVPEIIDDWIKIGNYHPYSGVTGTEVFASIEGEINLTYYDVFVRFWGNHEFFPISNLDAGKNSVYFMVPQQMKRGSYFFTFVFFEKGDDKTAWEIYPPKHFKIE
ncbi:MAG: hypothetical protein KKB03_04680 [Nanoarchaeota archaeon]|nr:hypothetical protein [Nanoarchaeota archaeon]MBU1135700.1 hypothetical protein [Nanoarchaeota archaeon]MBU2520508.1 hypothetical protein [Nanoarchaeota archaeon]